MTLTLLLFAIFATVTAAGYVIIPAVSEQMAIANEQRQQRFSTKMEQLVSRQEAKKVSRLFIIAPIALAGAFALLVPAELRVFGAIVGGVIGLIFPSFYIKTLATKAKRKFNDQLVDALMIMSSSFRGGLSLVQAMEAVVEEMPDPIMKEFGTVLGENKMGVSLEEAFYHLYNRMPSPALQQMITAILLARETGGNLPAIFTRIINNIRENKKIQQNLDTLTIQGKIQGAVMALLPVGFAGIVYSSNPRIFDHMLSSDVGRGMLIYAFISEAIGGFLVIKISTFKDF